MQKPLKRVSTQIRKIPDGKLLLLALVLVAMNHFSSLDSVSIHPSVLELLNTASLGIAGLIVIVVLLKYFVQFFVASRELSASFGHLVRSRLGIAASKAPEPYIKALFDGYAETFEQHLTSTLAYTLPEQIQTLLHAQLDLTKKYAILDLGCGTGLCGRKVESLAKRLVGVDLSDNMLEKAAALHIYDELLCDSLLKAPRLLNEKFDLVTAADVLIYFGDLQPAFEAVHSVLVPGGYFIFNLESTEQADWQLNSNGRYTHRSDIIQRLLEKTGFECVVQEKNTCRLEADEPVVGHLYLVKRSA